MVIRGEKLQTTLRRNVWRKREHPLRRATVPRAACTYPGPAGLERLWTTRHDLRSGGHRCFVYQWTLTLARARATGSRVPTAWYIIMTCTWAAPSHEGRVCRRPVYNTFFRARDGGGRRCDTVSNVITHKRTASKGLSRRPLYYHILVHTKCVLRTYTAATQFCVFCTLFRVQSLPTVVPRRAAQIIILMALS